MWKRGGRSSALDRAQALLSAKRSRGDARGSRLDPTATTLSSSGGSFKNKPAPPNTHSFLSDLSELSSDFVPSEPRGGDDRSADARSKYEEKLDSNKSSLGGGSRFLKKVSSTNNSQSSVSRKQEEVLEPRCEPFSPSRQPILEPARRKTSLTADLVIPPPAASQSTGAGTEQTQTGNHFLKKKADLMAERSSISPAVAQRSRDVGVRSRSRAGDPVQHSGGSERRSVRVTSAVDLESDEEDMRKLLGDSMDSSDYNFLEAQRPSSTIRPDKMLSHRSSRVRSPASPAHRSSPFRFTGQARAHFSPSVLSPSPSPPLPPPSPPKRLSSSLKAESPQRSLSSSSEQGGVLSLGELLPGGPDSEDPDSEMSSVSSEDFKINVMTVDELAPAFDGFSAETPGKQTKPADPDRGSLTQPPPQEQEQEQTEEEEVLDYQSDFESDSSSSQVSEHLPGDGEEEDVPSEVSVEASHPDVSHKKREDDRRGAFSDRSLSSTWRSSDRSLGSDSSSRDSRSSTLHSSSDSSRRRRGRASTRKAVKDSAAQTQPDPLSDPWSAGMATLDPTVATIYMNPAPAVTRAISAERLEAISTFDPAVFALNEILKQQLAVTRRIVEGSDHLHSCLLQSLEPPNYRYTMLEDTIQKIHKRRSPKLTIEKAVEEVLKEMTTASAHESCCCK